MGTILWVPEDGSLPQGRVRCLALLLEQDQGFQQHGHLRQGFRPQAP